MCKKQERWYIAGALFGGLLLVLTGCRTIQHKHLNNGILRDGSLQEQHISLHVRGKSLQIPLFRRGNEYHVAAMTAQGIGVYLHNRTDAALQVTLTTRHLTPEGKQPKKYSFVLAPKVGEHAKDHEMEGRTMRYVRFPSWIMPKSPRLGQFRVTYRGVGRQIYKGQLRVNYGQCQTYQQFGICPSSCMCASHYKRSKSVVRLDHFTRRFYIPAWTRLVP